jgi:CRISPR system Cascade subunit CasC
MTMFVETHILQNFAPSNLNRDDTGAPKECMFGGSRRARISSQCLKRAMRARFADTVGDGEMALRTKRLASQLAERLRARGHTVEEAGAVARAAVASSGIPSDDRTGLTSYLLFVDPSEIEGLAEVADRHWDQLLASVAESSAGKTTTAQRRERGREQIGREMRDVLTAGTGQRRAVDLALFGRMVADAPEAAVDACSQVAHAISTHRVAVEFDFYTAIDDLRPEDTAGAGMMGTVEFNSACYYRYANVNPAALAKELGDGDRARRALGAWLRAGIDAVPGGKQNSMAAFSRPSFVLAVLRDSQPCSLANAFVSPVSPDVRGADHDLIGASVTALDRHWGRLRDMYGNDGVVGAWVATTHRSCLQQLQAEVCDRDELVTRALAAAFDQQAA